MKVRVITGVLAFAFIFPFFWYSASEGIYSPLSYLFPAIMSLIAFISVWELLHCVGLDKKYVLAVPLYLAGLIFPVMARAMSMLGMQQLFIKIGVLTVLGLAVYFFSVIVFSYGKEQTEEEEQRKTGRFALVYMSAVYVIGAYSAVIMMRDLPRVGGFVYLIPFLFGWVTDTFAYFTGRLFGKHKLIPAVSPKKTVEGAIGGSVCCALVAMLYGLLVGTWFEVTPNYIALAFSGLLIAVVSQIGDLAMSAIKRQYGIKDYGKLLPGHGGLLDRFDSCIAVAIVVAVLHSCVPLFI